MNEVVTLWDLVGAALIFKGPTGIRYENQVGGTGCLVRGTEGSLVPFANVVTDPDGRVVGPSDALESYFLNGPHGGTGATLGLNEPDACEVEMVFAQWVNGPGAIRVDRDRLAQSCEAWVHVVVDVGATGLVARDPEGPTSRDAVLTWMNSD